MGQLINVETGEVTDIGRIGPIVGPSDFVESDNDAAKVFDVLLPEVTDEITLYDLNINSHGTYRIIVECINHTNKTDYIQMFINNDMVENNYRVTGDGAQKWSPDICRAQKSSKGGTVVIFVDIVLLQTGDSCATISALEKGKKPRQLHWHHCGADENINRIDIVAAVGHDIFGIGSRIRIYAMG